MRSNETTSKARASGPNLLIGQKRTGRVRPRIRSSRIVYRACSLGRDGTGLEPIVYDMLVSNLSNKIQVGSNCFAGIPDMRIEDGFVEWAKIGIW